MYGQLRTIHVQCVIVHVFLSVCVWIACLAVLVCSANTYLLLLLSLLLFLLPAPPPPLPPPLPVGRHIGIRLRAICAYTAKVSENAGLEYRQHNLALNNNSQSKVNDYTTK